MLTIIRGYYGTTAMSLPTTQLYNYALAWSTSLHSMIMHGGATGQMFSFDPEMGWGNLNTTGDIPAPRTNACLVAAYNGTKVILFGGYNTTKTVALNDIYILDIPTLTWTRGPAAHPSNARGGAACAASNDYFIATGGFSYSAMLNATIVYNIKTASWTSAYLPVPPPPTPSPSTSSSLTSTSTSTSSTSSSTSTLSASVTTTTPTPTSSTSGGGSHIITILGTFTGVFAAVFVAAGAVIYRKRTMNSNSPIDFDNNPPILANNHHTGSNNYPLSSMNSSGRLPDPPGGQPDLSYYTDNLISGHPFNPTQSSSSYSPAYPPPPPPPVVMNAYWAAPPVPEIKPLRNPAAIVAKENYVYPPRKYSVSSSGMAIEHKTVLGGLREPGSAQGDGNMESLATKKKLGSIQGGPHGSRRSTQHPHTYQETCKNDGEEQQDDILDAYQDHYYAKPNSRDPQTFQNYDEPHKVPYQ
ncbi:hypothetical protein EDD21DRAFT_356928 [Dissophora ornata]|nr:hypothetical protein EDD21DRAFT_356928 [Dissophora ornata]